VDLACDGTETILDTFVKCLAVLPNLHTLEVISMGTHYSQPLHDALIGVEFPQIRTLVLPSMAHCLLRHCPNVDDLTCTPFRPDQEFVESLAKGQQRLRRFAVLFPGNATAWTGRDAPIIPSAGLTNYSSELARVCPDISELSMVFVSSSHNLDRSMLTGAVTSGITFQGTPETASPHYQIFQPSKSSTSCHTTT
jgi:hypothetical protein